MDVAIQSAPAQTKLKGRKLKSTKTRCMHCFQECDGDVWIVTVGDKEKVVMYHRCPVHGEHPSLLSSDARYYYLASGDPGNACCVTNPTPVGTLGSNALRPTGLYEQLSSCISLIEIVESCNLTCPTCFSESPLGKQGEHLKYTPLDEIKRRIESVIIRKGEIEILQLSGGEPTLHPELPELLKWAGSHKAIRFIFLNSNGIRFARDQAFVESFCEAYPRGKLLLYLQFDGPQEEGQLELRGTDLRGIREEILATAARINLTVMLVMTVTKSNLPHVYKTVEFGLRYPNIRAAHFQPVFLSGRIPSTWSLIHEQPITTADVIESLIKGSDGLLSSADFTPLPCGDPNCHAISGVLRKEGMPLIPLSHLIDPMKLGAMKDKIHWELADLAQCGCDNDALGLALKQLALTEENAFAISVKPFMDVRTWDKDRTDRCCTHVVTEDGSLESFCRYYSGFPDTKKK